MELQRREAGSTASVSHRAGGVELSLGLSTRRRCKKQWKEVENLGIADSASSSCKLRLSSCPGL